MKSNRTKAMTKSLLPLALAVLAIAFAGCSNPFSRPGGVKLGSRLPKDADTSLTKNGIIRRVIPAPQDSVFDKIVIDYTPISKKAFSVELQGDERKVDVDELTKFVEEKYHVKLQYDYIDYAEWYSWKNKKYRISVIEGDGISSVTITDLRLERKYEKEVVKLVDKLTAPQRKQEEEEKKQREEDRARKFKDL